MILCRRLVLSSFRSFSSVVKKDPSLDYRPLALQARVDFLIRLGDLDTAAKHARLSREVSAHHNAESTITINQTCQAIIGAMCEAKRYEDALDLFHYFYRVSKITPCYGYFNHIIKLHVDQGRLDDALNLYDSSLANEVTKSLISKGLVDAGRQDEVMDRLDQPRWRWRWCSNLDWNANVYKQPMLEALLRQGDFEMANEVLGGLLGSSHVHGDGYDVVAIFSYTYMKYWFEQGKEDKAMHCYSLLQLRKLTKATVVNALLALLLKYGKKTEAWSLFDQVLHSKEMDNVNHYTLNIVVNEFFKIGRFDHAIQIFHKVKALKLNKNPHVVTCYRNIITRLNKQGILFEAEHLFQEMCSHELVSPDVSTYTSMIDAYLKAGRTEDALRLSNKMVDAFVGQLARLACL